MGKGPQILVVGFNATWEIIIGCPSILRTDRGTENAFLQPTLRHEHSDPFSGEKSFQHGRSTVNQVYSI